MMSRHIPLSKEVLDIMRRKGASAVKFEDSESEEDVENIVPNSCPESEETEEEEIVTRYKAIKASNPVYTLIPPHCSGYLPPRIDPATPKRDPIPTKEMDPDECFGKFLIHAYFVIPFCFDFNNKL